MINEQLLNYIRKLINQGISQNDVKVSLLANGWQVQDIDEAFNRVINNPSNIPTRTKRLKRILLIFSLITIAVVIFLGLIGFFLNKNKVHTPLTQITPTSTPFSNLFVVFIKITTTSAAPPYNGDLLLYDFSTRQTITPALPNSDTRDFLPSLGPWSPDGRYLAMLAVREISLSHPLYLYDNQTKKINKLLETNDYADLKLNSGVFIFSSYWPSINYFIFGTKYDPSARDTLAYTVGIDGKTSTMQNPKTIVKGNDRLEISSAFDNEEISKVKLDGKDLFVIPQGEVIGLTTKYMVSIKKPKVKGVEELSNDKSAEPLYSKVKSEEEQMKIMKDLLMPKTGLILHLYSLLDMQEVKNTTLPFNGWITVDAQIRPLKNTLILHEQDSPFPPYKSRYVELDLENLSNPKAISEEPGLDPSASQIIGEGSFGLTPDGKWLVAPQPVDVQSGGTSDVHYKIVAWNLDSLEKVIICESNCNSLRVFNPSRIRRK